MKSSSISSGPTSSRDSTSRHRRGDADSDASTRTAQQTQYEQQEFELEQGQTFGHRENFSTLDSVSSQYMRPPYYELQFEEPDTEYAMQTRAEPQGDTATYYNPAHQLSPMSSYPLAAHQSYQQQGHLQQGHLSSPESHPYNSPAHGSSELTYQSDEAIKSARRLSKYSERSSMMPYSKYSTSPNANFRKHKRDSSRSFMGNPDFGQMPEKPLSSTQSIKDPTYRSGKGQRSASSQFANTSFTYPPPPRATSILRFTEEDCANFPSLLRQINLGPDGPGQTIELERPDLRVEISMWVEERTLCLIVNSNGSTVTRRVDNNMINATKLLNACGLSRGRRDSILKEEHVRHVVKIGKMPLKGVWVPYERAMELAQLHGSVERLYPLFLADLRSFLYHDSNILSTAQVVGAAARDHPELASWKEDIPPITHM